MNHSKRPMTAQLRKKMRKAIRSAVPRPEERLTNKDIKAEDLLSTLRPKKKEKRTRNLKICRKIS